MVRRLCTHAGHVLQVLKYCMDAWQDAELWRSANGALRSLVTEDDLYEAFVEQFGGDLEDEADFTIRASTAGTRQGQSGPSSPLSTMTPTTPAPWLSRPATSL